MLFDFTHSSVRQAQTFLGEYAPAEGELSESLGVATLFTVQGFVGNRETADCRYLHYTLLCLCVVLPMCFTAALRGEHHVRE